MATFTFLHPRARIGLLAIAVVMTAAATGNYGLRPILGQVSANEAKARFTRCADTAPTDGIVSPQEMLSAIRRHISATAGTGTGCDMDGDGKATAKDTSLMGSAARSILSSVAPTARCGDGVVQSGEECDDKNTIDHDFCMNTCKKPVCGDGKKSLYEACDDGNTDENDGCTTKCKAPACGDTIVSGLEECDDGNQNNLDGCTASCKKVPVGSITKPPVATCGNGIVEPGERCDDGNTRDNDLMGKPDGCSSACLGTGQNGERCGDKIVQAALNEVCDGEPGCGERCTPLATCGNGRLDQWEQCDDANSNDGDGCTKLCRIPLCLDGIVQPGEECDDGAATYLCSYRCTRPVCGDGKVDGGEECDDGNSTDTDSCTSQCIDTRKCGDGIVQAEFEECDDGNTLNGDACPANCLRSRCGNNIREGLEKCDSSVRAMCPSDCGIPKIAKAGFLCGNGKVDAGEQCDQGSNNRASVARPYAVSQKDALTPTTVCTTSCITSIINSRFCGDKIVDTADSEECDDGNSIDHDLCTNACKKPVCGDGKKSLYEICDDGNKDENDDCTSKCTQPRCGDTIVSGMEECDDGNQNNLDGCTASCVSVPVGSAVKPSVSACGNGVLDAGEHCDDGKKNGQGCTGNGCRICSQRCTLVQDAQFCSDGIVQTFLGEECDDGNVIDDDGCSNACNLPVCGDGVRAGLEQCDDGNKDDNDACSNTCQYKFATCGNGVKEYGELCDYADKTYAPFTPPCTQQCTYAFCGDGVVQAGRNSSGQEFREGCDNGKGNGAACKPEYGGTCTYCSGTCTNAYVVGPRCGDRIVQPENGEQCDDAKNGNDHDTCTDACTLPICGDRIKDQNEECDDGNRVDTDACSNTCKAAKCGDGVVQAGEQCDGNWAYCNPKYGETCTYCGSYCMNVVAKGSNCGDKVIDAKNGEECDDGNAKDNDGCSAKCVREGCGDGIKQLGEQCDDGNRVDGDACTSACQLPVCGDRIVSAGEECDDANYSNTDDCTNACKKPRCGDGFRQSCFGRPFCPTNAYQEDCDDGNTKDGDGCSSQCTVR